MRSKPHIPLSICTRDIELDGNRHLVLRREAPAKNISDSKEDGNRIRKSYSC